jgi:hypothetical protein
VILELETVGAPEVSPAAWAALEERMLKECHEPALGSDALYSSGVEMRS